MRSCRPAAPRKQAINRRLNRRKTGAKGREQAMIRRGGAADGAQDETIILYI